VGPARATRWVSSLGKGREIKRERARKRESARAREKERERARKRESARARERERERARK